MTRRRGDDLISRSRSSASPTLRHGVLAVFRPILLALVLGFGARAGAQDGIPPDTLAALKRATVFVQTSGTGWKASGSGFVVAVQKDSVLIATNHHVVAAPDHDRRARPTATELVRSFKQVAVSVVFDPGTKTEITGKAEIIAADPDTDLAILRVARPKEAPAPIDIAAAPKPTETMPVYLFGFPFGQALATSKGAPAITVGKGSVSSLRLDEAGDLAMVQIDGALNPGNSGGPVVDVKGKLIGIAVATLKTGQGIGFAIPAAELAQVMKGRLGAIHCAAVPASGKVTVRIEVEVVDPAGAVRGVTFRHLRVAPNGAKPAPGDSLAARAGVKTLALKVADGVASGELILEAGAGDVYVQAVPEGGAGEKGATHIQPLAPTGQKGGPVAEDSSPFAKDPNAKPPAGWKDYVPKDRSYSIWIPTPARSQRERERTMTVQNQHLKSNILTVEAAGGLAYNAQVLVIENASTKENRAGFEELIRDLLTSETRGRVTSERDIKSGGIPGKEYRIESGRLVVRARVLAAGNWVLILQAVGPKELVDSDGSQLFFTSCRITADPRTTGPSPGGGGSGAPRLTPPPAFPAGPNAGTNAGPNAGRTPGIPVAPGRRSKIQGGFNEPEFAEEARAGAVLVGADIGLGKFFDNSVVSSIRPLYRSGGNDVEGAWHGPTAGKQIVRAVARPGYAVGAVTLNTGLGVDGVSFTFMRVVNGGLDPSDSYDSPWHGGPGGSSGRVKVGGTGTLAVGLIGKEKNEGITGLGLLYPDSALQASPQLPAANTGTPTPAWATDPQLPGSGAVANLPDRPTFDSGTVSKPPPTQTTQPETGKPPVIVMIVGGALAALTLLTIAILGGYLLMRSGKRGGGRSRRRPLDEMDDHDDDDDGERSRTTRNRSRR